MWRRSGGNVLRTLRLASGISILSFGMIPGTLPETLKIDKTGQRARSYLDRDPNRLLAFEMRCGSGWCGDEEEGADHQDDEDEDGDGTKLGDHIDEYNKLILDLANIDIEIEDEDQALMLLMFFPSSYENFMETLLYSRESLTMGDVLATLNSRELKKRTKGTKEETCDGLYVKERSDRSSKAHSDRSSGFKSIGGTSKRNCFICNSEGHIKRDCPMKKSSGFVKKGKRDQDSDFSDDEGNVYCREALVVVGNDEMTELVIDSCGSYHMTHGRDFLYDFKVVDGGSVQLGDNRTCIVKGTWKVKIQLHGGSSFKLEYVSGSKMVGGQATSRKDKHGLLGKGAGKSTPWYKGILVVLTVVDLDVDWPFSLFKDFLAAVCSVCSLVVWEFEPQFYSTQNGPKIDPRCWAINPHGLRKNTQQISPFSVYEDEFAIPANEQQIFNFYLATAFVNISEALSSI
nr:retrovirus-related Pol polyprotein from transposon TNT 1-94 [Tanacetum cinerariifolium]